MLKEAMVGNKCKSWEEAVGHSIFGLDNMGIQRDSEFFA
jgi:hypothetical protein